MKQEVALKKADKLPLTKIAYDGKPIWWFIRIAFAFEHIPIEELKFASLQDNKVVRTKLLAYRKALYYNELLKLKNAKGLDCGSCQDKVVFLTHTNSLLKSGDDWKVDRLDDLVSELSKQKIPHYYSVVEPLSSNKLKKISLYPNVLYSLCDNQLINIAKKESLRLHKEYSELKKAGELELIFDFYFSKEYLFLLVLIYELYKKLFQNKPKYLFLYSTGDLFSRCAIAAAEKMRVRQGSALHGLGMNLIQPQVPNNFDYFVPGVAYKNKLINYGVNKKNIYITGAQYLSKITKSNVIKRDDKIILVTSFFVRAGFISLEKYTELIEDILLQLSGLNNVDIIIKIHPREDKSFYEKLISKLKLSNIKVSNTRGKEYLYSLLNSSKLVVTLGSTVDVENILLGGYTVYIDVIPLPENIYNPNLSYPEVFFHTKDISKLKSKVLSVLNKEFNIKKYDSSRKQFIKDHFNSNKDDVSKNIVEIIRKN